MKKVVLIAIFLAFVKSSFSNPVVVTMMNEFQVSPDSLERIEFHRNISWGYSIDLGGWKIITTSGGQAIIDSGVVFVDSGYVVIDSTNTTGILSLDDTADSIKIIGDTSSSWYEPWYYPSDIPAPPSGKSASLFYLDGYDHHSGGMGMQIWDWYIDSTPTFGLENDDYPGCKIMGKVSNNQGVPIKNAVVTAIYDSVSFYFYQGPLYITRSTLSDTNGDYVIDSLLPSTFYSSFYYPYYRVTASASGFLPNTEMGVGPVWSVHPKTLNFVLFPTGIEEAQALFSRDIISVSPNPFNTKTTITINQLKINETPTPKLQIYDLSGRLVSSFLLNTHRLPITIILSDIAPGVYFAKLNSSEKPCITKLVCITKATF